MKTKKLSILAAVAFCLYVVPHTCFAQWSVGIEYNMAFPITGYGEVFKNGFNFNAEGKYHFKKGWAAGFQMGTARFTKFKEGSLPIKDPKLTVTPLIFTGEYEFNGDDVRPFVAAGLGLSIFSLSYYVNDPVLRTSETNVSFTMSPQIGVRFWFSKNMMTYLKGSYVILTDGPPVIKDENGQIITFPESDKATGYFGFAFGLSYRFNKTE